MYIVGTKLRYRMDRTNPLESIHVEILTKAAKSQFLLDILFFSLFHLTRPVKTGRGITQTALDRSYGRAYRRIVKGEYSLRYDE